MAYGVQPMPVVMHGPVQLVDKRPVSRQVRTFLSHLEGMISEGEDILTYDVHNPNEPNIAKVEAGATEDIAELRQLLEQSRIVAQKAEMLYGVAANYRTTTIVDSQLTSRERELTNSKAEVSMLTSELSMYRERVRLLSDEVSSLQGQLAPVDLQQRVESLEAALQNVTEEAARSNVRCLELERVLAERDQQLEEAAPRLERGTELEQLVEKLQNELSSAAEKQAEQLAEAQSRIFDLEQRLDTLSSETSNAQARKLELEHEVAELRNVESQHLSQITSLEVQITEARSREHQMAARLDDSSKELMQTKVELEHTDTMRRSAEGFASRQLQTQRRQSTQPPQRRGSRATRSSVSSASSNTRWSTIPEAYREVMLEVERVGWDNMDWAGGFTLLHWAGKHDHADLCRWCIKRGANAFAKDDFGHTPADYAREQGSSAALGELDQSPQWF